MKNQIDICALQEKLERCRKMEIDDVDINEIDDISEIKISRKKSSNEKILDFLIATKNPYIFKVNGRIVKIEFSNNNKKAEDCITNVIKSIYR